MRGYNKVIIMGNLTSDPESRYTQSQKAVVNFRMAVNRMTMTADGNKREEVIYIPVVVFGKTAELCEKYLQKGSGVLVEGRLNIRSYDGKDGAKKWSTEVIADVVQFVGGRQARDESPAPETHPEPEAVPSGSAPVDLDIPF